MMYEIGVDVFFSFSHSNRLICKKEKLCQMKTGYRPSNVLEFTSVQRVIFPLLMRMWDQHTHALTNTSLAPVPSVSESTKSRSCEAVIGGTNVGDMQKIQCSVPKV